MLRGLMFLILLNRLAFVEAPRPRRHRDVPDCGAVFCAFSPFSASCAPCRPRVFSAFCASSRAYRARPLPARTAPAVPRRPCVCVSYAYSYAF
uniref:Putative secreted protein n=1 Tax=Anopheles triannulatus TaxID=58253 RepID=A0A2M4B4W1_9DIPT